MCSYLKQGDRTDKDVLPVPDYYLFVCSNDTKEFADKIVKQLMIKNRCDLISLGNDMRRNSVIKCEIGKALDKLYKTKGKFTTLHLNYTGGTKPMAVHSHALISECAAKYGVDGKNVIFSDLDPEKNKILLDNDDFYPTGSDLRNYVKLSIFNLFDLHNMEIKNRGFDSKCINLNIFEYAKDFSKELKSLKGNCQIVNFFRSFEIEWSHRNRAVSNLEQETKKQFDKYIEEKAKLYNFESKKIKDMSAEEIETIVKFFKGGWLEDLILEKVKEIGRKYCIDEARRSVKPQYKGRDCEIDVIVMKGYQMFLFSCTTSQDIKLVKQKAFEAIYRAQQLGGDHAQVIVVNLMNNKAKNSKDENNNETLDKDLSSFGAQKNVSLIGFEDIIDEQKLENKLMSILSR